MVHAQVGVSHLYEAGLRGFEVDLQRRLKSRHFLSNVARGPLPLCLLADVGDVAARKVDRHTAKLVQVSLGQLLGVPLEDGGTSLSIRKLESNAQVEPRNECGVKVLLSVGCANYEHVAIALEAVNLAEKSGQDAPSGFVKSSLSGCRQRVNLVNEYDDAAHSGGSFKDLGQL